jgi:hypothetical protein
VVERCKPNKPQAKVTLKQIRTISAVESELFKSRTDDHVLRKQKHVFVTSRWIGRDGRVCDSKRMIHFDKEAEEEEAEEAEGDSHVLNKKTGTGNCSLMIRTI